MASLLSDRPEGETILLPVLVNKLGHPSHRVGARVAQLMEKLLLRHMNMRQVVVEEVERLLRRKNIPPRARHYGLHFLTKVRLRVGEPQLAAKMIEIYLGVFGEVMGRWGLFGVFKI